MVERAFFIGAILLLASLLLLGCASIQGGGAVDMMKKVPMDSDSFVFVDIDAFRTDIALEEAYTALEEIFEEFVNFPLFNFNDVDRLAPAWDIFDTMLVEGDFNLNEIRKELEELRYDDDEYRGIEVWGQEDMLVALLSNKLAIIGTEDTVTDYIKVIKEGDASLYDDVDFRDIVGRLPRGIIVACEEHVFPITSSRYDGLEVAGISMMRKDKNNMAITGVFKFESGDAARAAMDEIEYDLESDELEDWKNIDITQDAEFVELTVEQDIEDAFD